MSEKEPLLPQADVVVVERQPSRARVAGRTLWMTLFYSTMAFLILRVLVIGRHGYSHHHHIHGEPDDYGTTQVHSQSKVALEAHIMSKCPDAKRGLEQLVVPAMEKISDLVDFKLSYIGNLGDHDNDVECMHGPEECLGNIIELCAADIYPEPKLFLGFTMCMTADYQHIPERALVQDCALEFGLDFDKINDCVSKDDGAYGLDLLRNSVERTKKANVTASLTLRLNNEIRCIMDGGEWKHCPGGSKVEDLVGEIKELSED